MKKVLLITTMIAIGLIAYIVLFKIYTINTAIDNGDFVTGAETINYSEFDRFMDDMHQDIESSIRITVYSKEGKPMIHDLNYRDGLIYCETDETKANLLKFFKNEIEEYTDIIFKDLGFAKDYFIVNDSKEKYLFQILQYE